MTGALLILAVTVLAGLLLFVADRFNPHHGGATPEPRRELEAGDASDLPTRREGAPAVCCGQHMVCAKTSLTPYEKEIVYYDDEELDRYAGRRAESYTPEEEEEFRSVLLTMLPQDVAGWVRSLAMRGVELPPAVREEVLMVVSEVRGAAAAAE